MDKLLEKLMIGLMAGGIITIVLVNVLLIMSMVSKEEVKTPAQTEIETQQICLSLRLVNPFDSGAKPVVTENDNESNEITQDTKPEIETKSV